MISTARIFGALLALGILFAQPAPAAQAQAAPYCAPGTSPRFANGFGALKASLGAVMGDPTECEHTDGNSGDVLQHTTTGLSFTNVVSVRIFLTDFKGDYARMNEIYATYFPADRRPARTTIGVTALARDGAVEIDMIAVRP